MKKKIFVQHKKRLGFEFLFKPAHDLKKLVARFVEVDELPFSTEHGRRGTEITTHRTTNGWDQNGSRTARCFREGDPQNPGAKTGEDRGMPDRSIFILAKKSPSFTESLSFPLNISNTSAKPVTIQGIEVKGSGVKAALNPKKLVVEPGASLPFHIKMTLAKESGRYLYTGRLLLHTNHDREKEISLNYFVQVGNRK